jgi:hypothetical protein
MVGNLSTSLVLVILAAALPKLDRPKAITIMATTNKIDFMLWSNRLLDLVRELNFIIYVF